MNFIILLVVLLAMLGTWFLLWSINHHTCIHKWIPTKRIAHWRGDGHGKFINDRYTDVYKCGRCGTTKLITGKY